MEFLGEEVDGVLTAQKIHGDTPDHPNKHPLSNGASCQL